jgi:hypothetical protein
MASQRAGRFHWHCAPVPDWYGTGAYTVPIWPVRAALQLAEPGMSVRGLTR